MITKLETVDVMPTRIRIASIIRKAILSGEFSEGEELLLTQTATQLGVSRTPVREAFQMLESEGLIELRMNRGAVVKGITIKIIRDHFDMRILLEGEAVSKATANNIDIKELEESQHEILSLGSDFTSSQYISYNQLFHTSIWKAANNHKLYSILTSLWNGSSFGKTTSELDHYLQSIQEHGLILEYIKNEEPLLARKEMEFHISRSMQNIIDSYNFK